MLPAVTSGWMALRTADVDEVDPGALKLKLEVSSNWAWTGVEDRARRAARRAAAQATGAADDGRRCCRALLCSAAADGGRLAPWPLLLLLLLSPPLARRPAEGRDPAMRRDRCGGGGGVSGARATATAACRRGRWGGVMSPARLRLGRARARARGACRRAGGRFDDREVSDSPTTWGRAVAGESREGDGGLRAMPGKEPRSREQLSPRRAMKGGVGASAARMWRCQDGSRGFRVRTAVTCAAWALGGAMAKKSNASRDDAVPAPRGDAAATRGRAARRQSQHRGKETDYKRSGVAGRGGAARAARSLGVL